jgi:hypothetical protein
MRKASLAYGTGTAPAPQWCAKGSISASASSCGPRALPQRHAADLRVLIWPRNLAQRRRRSLPESAFYP